MRAVAILPHPVQVRIGALLGWMLARIQRRQRRIAARNLEICFPELDVAERSRLLERHFRSLGLSLVEMAIAWYSPAATIRRLVHVEGREHLDAALARGRGVLLVTAHFTMLELGVAVLESLCGQVTCLYRPQRNAMMDALILRGRSRFSRTHVSRDNVRAVIRRLKANDAVLYLPDQTYLGNQSVLLPFFGEPALTNVATSKLARIGDAVVLTYFFRRAPDDSGYTVHIGPPFADLPSADAEADAVRIFSRLEDYIRGAPEQYLWTYKKFKKRPPPLTDPYAIR